VTDKMHRGRYQPLLLLYQRHNPALINTDTAPKETTVVQNFVSRLSSLDDSGKCTYIRCEKDSVCLSCLIDTCIAFCSYHYVD